MALKSLQSRADRQVDDERMVLRERLAERILRHLPEAGDHQSAAPELAFFRRNGYTEPMSVVYPPSLSLVVQGRKRVVLGSETFEYDEGRFVLTSVDLPTVAQALDGNAAYPFLSLKLTLDLPLVREVAADIALHGPHADHVGPGMTVGVATAELLDAIGRLAALADTPQDLPILGRLVLREIVYRVLVGHAGAQLRQIARHGSRGDRLAGVIAWLRDHYAEPIRIEELADKAAMGVSTLHHQFVALTRMSPLKYQKQLRLHEARRLLLTEELDAASVAFRVGYESTTQFSREYRRLFGNPPMRDISRLRNP